MVFKRKIYSQMLEWKNHSNGKTALLLKGARRVGKSTIVEEFARNEYDSFIHIDFSKIPKQVRNLFDDISDLDFLFLQLQLIYKVELKIRRSVIIFDEVQLEPLARQAIKHLVADGRYDYIETGSLIGIRKYTQNIVIPSEEKPLEMFPLDYEEFRWALGDKVSVPMLMTFFDRKRAMGDAVCRQMLRDYRLYMLVGGMPQAVNEYLETNNLVRVDEMKRSILSLYDSDMRKIDAAGRAAMMFGNVAAQLSHGGSRFQVSSVIENQRADDVLPIVEDMKASMMVNVANHCDDPNIGMSLTRNLEKFKLYMNDTGLFVTHIYKDKNAIDNIIYQKLLSDKLDTNLGYIFENMVAQTLRCKGDDLYYHTFQAETPKRSYEIDFLLSRNDKLCPLEVKSSGYSTHASIDEFSKRFSNRIRDKYLIYTKDFRKDKDITMIPVYLTQFI